MLTIHASRRSQQRAIPPIVLELLIDYGEYEHDNCGAAVYYFNKLGKEQVRLLLKQRRFTQTDHCLDAYLVMAGDGNIITTGHLAKRINRI